MFSIPLTVCQKPCSLIRRVAADHDVGDWYWTNRLSRFDHIRTRERSHHDRSQNTNTFVHLPDRRFHASNFSVEGRENQYKAAKPPAEGAHLRISPSSFGNENNRNNLKNNLSLGCGLTRPHSTLRLSIAASYRQRRNDARITRLTCLISWRRSRPGLRRHTRCRVTVLPQRSFVCFCLRNVCCRFASSPLAPMSLLRGIWDARAYRDRLSFQSLLTA